MGLLSYEPPPYPGRNYRKRRSSELSLEEKIAIVHDYLIGKEKQSEVAKVHRVTTSLVCALVLKARRNPKFLEELRAERDMANKKVEAVILETRKALTEGTCIHKASLVRRRVKMNQLQ